MNDSTESDSDSRSEQRTRWFEQIVVAISVILTVGLLGYAVWQIFPTAGAVTPQAHVEDTRSQPDGSVTPL